MDHDVILVWGGFTSANSFRPKPWEFQKRELKAHALEMFEQVVAMEYGWA